MRKSFVCGDLPTKTPTRRCVLAVVAFAITLGLETSSHRDSPVAVWADPEPSVTQVFLWKCFYFEDKSGSTSRPPVSTEHGLVSKEISPSSPLFWSQARPSAVTPPVFTKESSALWDCGFVQVKQQSKSP